MCISRLRSSKVVDFGTNQKGVCDFLLVINSNFSPVLDRFADTATYGLKMVNFSYPTLIFLDEFFTRKTRVLGLSVGEDFVILARVVFTQYQLVTDRRTDNPSVANTGLCIASYAGAL